LSNWYLELERDNFPTFIGIPEQIKLDLTGIKGIQEIMTVQSPKPKDQREGIIWDLELSLYPSLSSLLENSKC